MEAEGRPGAILAGDGTLNTFRQGREGDLVVQEGHARYQEGCVRGQIFSSAVASVAPGTALGTTPPFVLWNPPSSGKNLVVITTSLGYVSGTLGAGFIAYAAVISQLTVPSGGTELTVTQNILSLTKGTGRAFSGSTVASTPIILRPGYFIGGLLVGTAFPMTLVKDEVAGEYVIPPGSVFVIQGVTAAGGTPLVAIGGSWQEVPTQLA